MGPRAEDRDLMVASQFSVHTFVQAFRFIWDERGLLAQKTVEHLALSAVAIAIALVVALPLGVWLGHLHRGSFIAINASNVGRALPSLAVISIGLGIFGIGYTDVVVGLVVLAFPPMLTNAFVAVDGVDEDVVEAARGMGFRPWQVLLQVELPLALPLIFAGIRTSAVFIVSTATLAGVVGGGALGDIIFNQASYFLSGVVGASIIVSALAFAADFTFAGLQRLLTPRGLRYANARHASENDPPPSMLEAAAVA
ncbi:MAG: ABC transporter permease [Gaiellaceae bacterium]